MPTGLTVGDLVRNPNFPQILQAGARTLIALNDLFPRVARLVASHQKWMLTQAAYSLHLERDVNNPESGITAARLLKFMRDTGGASRNTAAAFLAELVAYKMLQRHPADVPRERVPSSRPRSAKPRCDSGSRVR